MITIRLIVIPLPKHILCECKHKFDGRKFNSNQQLDNCKYQYDC